MDALNFDDFAARYCERQEQTPEGLKVVLLAQADMFDAEGWMLLECQVMDSSRLGELVIMPYGGQSTFKTVPDHPISPRGLASDMSIVVATLAREELPS